MFTGIVRGIGTVLSIERKSGLHDIVIELPEGARDNIERGASIAVDGVCLTVAAFNTSTATFNVMQQTLNATTLGKLERGSRVNIERAALSNQEIGGHQLSGHIDFVATIADVETPENNRVLSIQVAPAWQRYIFAKGYVAINGASLTIASVDKATDCFKIWLIPETLRLTTFEEKGVGAPVNIEIDRTTQILVDTVYNFLQERLGAGDLNTTVKDLLGQQKLLAD